MQRRMVTTTRRVTLAFLSDGEVSVLDDRLDGTATRSYGGEAVAVEVRRFLASMALIQASEED